MRIDVCKKKIFSIFRLIKDSKFRNRVFLELGAYKNLTDREFIELAYKTYFDKNINWESPASFNEKLQWLKLYDHNDQYTMMVDKFKVRDYVAALIGEQYLIPLLGVWNTPDEIDFNLLPQKFVLKCNHNSGTGMVICKDKNKLNINKVRKGLWKGLKEDYFSLGREWPYKNVERKVIFEQFMSSSIGEDLADYKIHCFNGDPRFVLVCRDRFSDSGLTEDFFDTEWNHLDIRRENSPNSPLEIPKPQKLEKMFELARILSANVPFLRVDFYEIDNQVFFGELTFFPASGFAKFIPEIWDYSFGEMLILPTN